MLKAVLRVYKQVGRFQLTAHLFLPKRPPGVAPPAVVAFFHGGEGEQEGVAEHKHADEDGAHPVEGAAHAHPPQGVDAGDDPERGVDVEQNLGELERV
jgi:hypothetical protein